MDQIFSSRDYELVTQSARHHREEIFISSSDATRSGLKGKEHFAILTIEHFCPGPPSEEYAVRIKVRDNIKPGKLGINQIFFESTQLQLDQNRSWYIKLSPNLTLVKEVALEAVTEQNAIEPKIHALQRERQDLFVNRCLLFQGKGGIKSLSLTVAGQGYFNIHSIKPSLKSSQSPTILVFDENTRFKLFVPHSKRKRAVDMVVVVDASNSMELKDYVDASNDPKPRLVGVQRALEALFQQRLHAAGSRISRIAVVVFARNTGMLYPSHAAMANLQNIKKQEVHQLVHNLCNFWLVNHLKIARDSTNISAALRFSAELLNYYSEEESEKVLLLLSDGADWVEEKDGTPDGEIIHTLQEPAVLAGNLHYDSKIRIHTVAISNEQNCKAHLIKEHRGPSAIPNTDLLREIAQVTKGMFFESPDARVLLKLLNEIGQGALYSIN